MSQASYLRLASGCLLGIGLIANAIPTPFVSAQEAIQAPQPKPMAIAEGSFVPADLLLKMADARHPPTMEGWIVQDESPKPFPIVIDPAKETYERYDYPLRLRQYDSQIRIARAELESWHRRLTVYRYFNKTGALMVTHENAMLSLIQAEENLRNLRYERMLFMREHQRQRKMPIAEYVINTDNGTYQ